MTDKATITPEKGEKVEAMFNPDQIKYTKRNTWNTQPTNGQSLPPGSFSASSPATLDVTLIFDGTEKGDDVSKKLDKLVAMTKVNDTLPNGSAPGSGHGHAQSQSQQHRPPTVTFQWGTYLSFKAVITSIVGQYSLFLDNGTPVRASVAVTFQQIGDKDVFPDQNPTSGGRTGERIHRLAPRETLDQVAYESFGKTGLWRALAAYNGIDDPLQLQAGDPILLPPSIDDLKAFA
jgi:hypothetical protein